MDEQQNGTGLRQGDESHGFVVRRVSTLTNLRATAYEAEHAVTGARFIHVSNEDTENLFSVTFPTPPPDDTGLPHILEHAVLDGSQKFPVRRPFFEMIKMSMATFINAMTGGDKTMYPVSSNVEQDLFNLADVYFDAVFHPSLSEFTFMQEGHSLAFKEKGDTESDLVINGIVYNEMKGAFSNPDAVVGRRMLHSLLPDTIYSRESGGDPEHIPELTYEQFKEFHRTFYHPSNAYFIVYGNAATEKYLAFLEERLGEYERLDVDSRIAPQPRWDEPRVQEYPYPIGESEDPSKKSYVIMNWIAADGTDASEALAFNVLSLSLTGNQGAPLRKAVVDSKLGQDMTHTGFYTLGSEGVFSVGVKGSEAEVRERFERLVTDTLSGIAREGIGRDRIESAFRQLSYRYLEIQSMFPLHVMLRIQESWLCGADPLSYLRADEIIADLRKRWADDPRMFEKLIEDRLLSNAHRLTCVFVPDKKMQAERDRKTSDELARRKSAMGDDELARVASTVAELEKLQSTSNSAEELATLPQLTVSDLPAKPRHIPTTVEKVGAGELLTNDVFANGVSYVQIDMSIEGLSEELLPYLSLYGECVRKMGAAGQDYVRIAERVASHTGGISMWPFCGTRADDADRMLARARFATKALDAQLPDALQLIRDLMLEIDFSDASRLKDVVDQRKVQQRGSLSNQGSTIASLHAALGMSRPSYANELIRGLPQYRLTEGLSCGFDEACGDLVSKLEAIREFLRSRDALTVSFTGSSAGKDIVVAAIERLTGEMGAPKGPAGDWLELPDTRPRDGLAAPMDVAHCAMALPAPHISDATSPALSVAGRLLSLDYLLEEIRVKGGAYGAGCHHDALGCSWRFHSYNDPSIKRTLDVYRATIDYVKGVSWSDSDIGRAVIGSAKSAEEPIRPDSATGRALHRHVCGDTAQLREQRYAAMIGTTPEKAKGALLSVLEADAAAAGVCVVSSRPKLEDANLQMQGQELAIEDVIRP